MICYQPYFEIMLSCFVLCCVVLCCDLYIVVVLCYVVMFVMVKKGWEEAVDLSLTYLLKTSLAKSVKETASLATTQLEVSEVKRSEVK